MRKETGFAIASLSLGVLVAVVVAEVVLRVFAPAWLEQKMTELRAGQNFGSDAGWSVERRDGQFYSFTPGAAFPVRHYEYDHTAHVDSLGGRRTVDEECGQQPIVPVIGDSFAFGTGVKDAETFVSRLSRRMDVCLVNLGVPGTGLHDHVEILKARHESLGRPDFYVFTHYTGNDLHDAWQNMKIRDGTLERGKETSSDRPGLLARINHFVNESSVLRRVYLLQFAKGVMLSYTSLGDEHVSTYFQIAHRTKYDRSYGSSFQEAVSELEKQAQSKDFRYVVVMIPSKWEVNDEEFVQQVKFYGMSTQKVTQGRPGNVAESVFQKYGIKYIDLTNCLRDISMDGDLYYEQDTHFTAQGHRWATDCMYTRLTEVMGN